MCDPWPIVWPCACPAGSTPEQTDAATSAAEQILWGLTGRRLGLCTVTEAYAAATSGECGSPWMTADRVWHNGPQSGSCCSIHLERLPVSSITSVTVMGVVQDPSTYALSPGGRLRRIGACWPTGIECGQAPITVTYRWGIPLTAPDPDASPTPIVAAPLWGMAATAMGEVANELLRAMCGEACKLPSRLTSIVRQGVTMTFGSPEEYATNGMLGTPLADALIRQCNPSKHQQRSRVYSPDMATRL